jgi:hypothetical protein
MRNRENSTESRENDGKDDREEKKAGDVYACVCFVTD